MQIDNTLMSKGLDNIKYRYNKDGTVSIVRTKKVLDTFASGAEAKDYVESVRDAISDARMQAWETREAVPYQEYDPVTHSVIMSFTDREAIRAEAAKRGIPFNKMMRIAKIGASRAARRDALETANKNIIASNAPGYVKPTAPPVTQTQQQGVPRSQASIAGAVTQAKGYTPQATSIPAKPASPVTANQPTTTPVAAIGTNTKQATVGGRVPAMQSAPSRVVKQAPISDSKRNGRSIAPRYVSAQYNR